MNTITKTGSITNTKLAVVALVALAAGAAAFATMPTVSAPSSGKAVSIVKSCVTTNNGAQIFDVEANKMFDLANGCYPLYGGKAVQMKYGCTDKTHLMRDWSSPCLAPNKTMGNIINVSSCTTNIWSRNVEVVRKAGGSMITFVNGACKKIDNIVGSFVYSCTSPTQYKVSVVTPCQNFTDSYVNDVNKLPLSDVIMSLSSLAQPKLTNGLIKIATLKLSASGAGSVSVANLPVEFQQFNGVLVQNNSWGVLLKEEGNPNPINATFNKTSVSPTSTIGYILFSPEYKIEAGKYKNLGVYAVVDGISGPASTKKLTFRLGDKNDFIWWDLVSGLGKRGNWLNVYPSNTITLTN